MEMEFEKMKWWEYLIVVPIAILIFSGIFYVAWTIQNINQEGIKLCESRGGEHYKEYNGFSGDEDFCLIDGVEYYLRYVKNENTWRIVKK